MQKWEQALPSTARGITDPTRKQALLLYQAGARVRKIFKQLPKTGEANDYDTAKQKLQAHFDPQKNRRYEVYRFRQTTQELNETLDHFHPRLRTLSATCEFTDVDFEIEEQIIIGGSLSKIRKRALRDPTFDLKAMLVEGRRDEQSTYQAKQIESKDTVAGEANKLGTSTTCRNCGHAYPHTGDCPAKGKTCNSCGKLNHFVAACRGKQQRPKIPRYQNKPSNPTLPKKNLKTPDKEMNSSSDDDYLYSLDSMKNNNKVNVTVGGGKIKVTIDTDATINVIDHNTYRKMHDVTLAHTKTQALAYDTKFPVEFLGKFEAEIETKKTNLCRYLLCHKR